MNKNNNKPIEPKAIICLKLFENNHNQEEIEIEIDVKGTTQDFDEMTNCLSENANNLEIQKAMMILEAIVKIYNENKI